MEGDKMSLFQKISGLFRRDTSAYAAARELAHLFVTECGVKEVWLFGSVAREGDGADVDMIISMGDGRDLRWVENVQAKVGTMYSPVNGFSSAYNAEEVKRDRWLAVQRQLQPSRATHDKYYDICVERGIGLPDLFMLPHNWRERLWELQHRLGLHDPQFMWNVAREARRYDPVRGKFEQPEPAGAPA